MERHLLNTVCGNVDSSDHIDRDGGHCDKTCWAIQLYVGVASEQDTDKFLDQRLGYLSRIVNVEDATHTVTIFSVSC